MVQAYTETSSRRKNCNHTMGLYTVHTNRKIDANRLDIIIKNHEERTCIMMDVAVPSDENISLKEFQKLSKYKDLEIEVTKMWKLKTNYTSGNWSIGND